MKPLPKNCWLVFGEAPPEAAPEAKEGWWVRFQGGTVPEVIGPFETAAEAQEKAYDLWGPSYLYPPYGGPNPTPAPAKPEGPEAYLASCRNPAAKAWRAEKAGLDLFAGNFVSALEAKAAELLHAAKRIQTARTNGGGPLALARELEAAGTFNGFPVETARANYYLGLLRAEELLGKGK